MTFHLQNPAWHERTRGSSSFWGVTREREEDHGVFGAAPLPGSACLHAREGAIGAQRRSSGPSWTVSLASSTSGCWKTSAGTASNDIPPSVFLSGYGTSTASRAATRRSRITSVNMVVEAARCLCHWDMPPATHRPTSARRWW